MNKEWSDQNKQMQKLISKQQTFDDGIKLLFELREKLFLQITQIINGYPAEAFWKMPFKNADGYHNLTLAFSIWHIFRIEDIVVHSLILNNKQIFFSSNWQEEIGSKIVTTGNELQSDEIEEFSKHLNVSALYDYATAVKASTDEFLTQLKYDNLKQTFGEEDKKRLIENGSISHDEDAVWLIDYWCGKDIAGLIKMPLSRHWIMHVEAMQRIKNKLCKLARKGVDPIAYCGFSCNHCFLGQWCGSCRTNYNVCSFATCSPDKKCPNAVCCQEKKIDGCYECSEIEKCTRGFYAETNDGAKAAKAQAMFIAKYGKKAFLQLHDLLHQKYEFAKTQEILGQDLKKGFEFLEQTWEERQ